MPPAGFEPTIPGRERPQTHALDSTATGISVVTFEHRNNEESDEQLHLESSRKSCVLLQVTSLQFLQAN